MAAAKRQAIEKAVAGTELAELPLLSVASATLSGGFDGPEKVYRPRGFVRDRDSNAVWGMQFVWPIKAEYLVVYLDEGYTQTVIGRSKRDYVWIMAREPRMPESDYRGIIGRLEGLGYDVSRIETVPQRW